MIKVEQFCGRQKTIVRLLWLNLRTRRINYPTREQFILRAMPRLIKIPSCNGMCLQIVEQNSLSSIINREQSVYFIFFTSKILKSHQIEV